MSEGPGAVDLTLSFDHPHPQGRMKGSMPAPIKSPFTSYKLSRRAVSSNSTSDRVRILAYGLLMLIVGAGSERNI